MRRLTILLVLAGVALGACASDCLAETGWSGKRRVSFQRQNDLFYNYYVGPNPSGTAAEMYISPLPTPVHVGHTWNTYQPVLPHEFTYKHKREYWTHNPGGGWRQTSVRYGNKGYFLQSAWMSQVKPHYYPVPANFQ